MRVYYKQTKTINTTPQDTINFKRSRADYEKPVAEAKLWTSKKFRKSEISPFGKTKNLACRKLLYYTLEVFPTMIKAVVHSRFGILKFLN